MHGYSDRPTRRDFLKRAAAALAGLTLSRAAWTQGTIALGIQLYTVRDQMMLDVPGTLARLAEIGYREVEFAGYFGIAPSEIRRLVDRNGLSAPSAHLGALNKPSALEAEAERAIADTADAGHQWLVMPSIDPEHRRSLDHYRELADSLNRFGERCREAGLDFAYHNHDFEFQALDGAVPFDLLMERTDPALVSFELDLYWAIHAGRDPRDLLDRYRGRFPMCHVKDRAPNGAMVDVGAGKIDFGAIFADANADFVHYFIEHDRPTDSMATAAASFTSALAALNRSR